MELETLRSRIEESRDQISEIYETYLEEFRGEFI